MDESSSPPELNENEADNISHLLEMIESNNWAALRRTIDSSPATFQRLARKVARAPNLNGMSILHACCRFNPPLYIVQIILDLLPESPTLVDCMNRTPLHIAAGTRADLSTLQLLVRSSPIPCSIQDVDGMTPLHFACDSTCELFEGDENCKRELPTIVVLSTLIRAYPLALTLDDNGERNALEYAILTDAPLNVVRFLQYVTRQQNQIKAQQEMILQLSSTLHRRGVSLDHRPRDNHLPPF